MEHLLRTEHFANSLSPPELSIAEEELRRIALRVGTQPSRRDGVDCYFAKSVTSESDRKEFAVWGRYDDRVSKQSDGTIIFNDILLKANFIQTFRSLIPRLQLSGSEQILEMGAGTGWASILLKCRYPSLYAVASDLVPESLKHAWRWEKMLDARIDEKWAFNCRDLPFADGQFDRVFTFAAFHHFGESGDFGKSLEEMVRVLKPGGRIDLLYEPYAPRYLYALAHRRANRQREGDGVDEDVILLPRLKSIVKQLGCRLTVELFPLSWYRKSPAASVYYFFLSKLGPLKRLFSCSVNLAIHKP